MKRTLHKCIDFQLFLKKKLELEIESVRELESERVRERRPEENKTNKQKIKSKMRAYR